MVNARGKTPPLRRDRAASQAARTTAATTVGLPWRWNSATSSPVKLRGEGKQAIRAESSTLPSAEQTSARTSVRAGVRRGRGE